VPSSPPPIGPTLDHDFTEDLSSQEISAYRHLEARYGQLPYDIQRLSRQAECWASFSPYHIQTLIFKVDKVLQEQGFNLTRYAPCRLDMQIITRTTCVLDLSTVLNWAHSRIQSKLGATSYYQYRSRLHDAERTIKLHSGKLATISSIIGSYLEPPSTFTTQFGHIQDIFTVLSIIIDAGNCGIYSKDFTALSKQERDALKLSWRRFDQARTLCERIDIAYERANTLREQIMQYQQGGLRVPDSPEFLFSEVEQMGQRASNIFNKPEVRNLMSFVAMY
jgi:hypothetical protein